MKELKIHNLAKEICLVGILTACAILFSILSNFFVVPFATWLTIDVSPIFIVGIYLFVERRPLVYSLGSVFIVSLFTFINMGLAGWVGVLINFCSNLIYLLVNIVVIKILRKLLILKTWPNLNG